MAPPDDPRSDAELVRAAGRGETLAFDALYRRHKRFVLAVARRAAGTREDAEDAVQETFVELARRAGALATGGSGWRLASWLHPVARRFAIRARERSRRLRSDEEALEQVALDSADVASDERDELGAIVGGLPAELRETLLLRYADALELADVAAALGVPLGTVKSRLHRAIELLAADPRARRWLD